MPVIIFLYFFLKETLAESAICWKESYGRGAGVPLSSCSEKYERSGALCYPKCQDGYTGNGPVCWENCRQGYDDHGATCFKNANVYGKGCCCTLLSTNCCGICNVGYKDDGCTCRKDVEIYFKKSYTRTAGVPMICKSDEEQSGALCYPRCRDGFGGLGPICWKSCRNPLPYDCFLYCTSSINFCPSSVLGQVVTALLPSLIFTEENKCK